MARARTQDECKEELRGIHQELKAFSKAADGASVKAYYTTDAVVRDAEKIYSGIEAVGRLLEESYKNIGSHEYEFINPSYEGSNNYIYLNTKFVLKAEAGAHHGHMEQFWQRTDVGWKITFQRFSMD